MKRSINRAYRRFCEENREPLSKFINENEIQIPLQKEVRSLIFELVKKGAPLEKILSGEIIYDSGSEKSARSFYRTINNVFEKLNIMPLYDASTEVTERSLGTIKGLIDYIKGNRCYAESIVEDGARVQDELGYAGKTNTSNTAVTAVA